MMPAGLWLDNGWQRKFEDPISLPADGRSSRLRDAADYITSLPKKESDLPEWQRHRRLDAGVAAAVRP